MPTAASMAPRKGRKFAPSGLEGSRSSGSLPSLLDDAAPSPAPARPSLAPAPAPAPRQSSYARPSASDTFWAESQAVAGAILRDHSSASEQRSNLLTTLSFWEATDVRRTDRCTKRKEGTAMVNAKAWLLLRQEKY